MKRERISRVLPQKIREMMEHPSSELYPYAREACYALLMKETVGEGRKRFFCTVCGESFEVKQRQTVCDELAAELFYSHHGGKGECMRCGAEGEVIEGKRWNLKRHSWYAPLCVRVQLDGLWQTILCFEVRRRIYHHDDYGFYQDLALAKEDVFLLGEGAAGHYQYRYYYQDFHLMRKIDADGSKIRGGFGEPFAKYTGSTGNMSYEIHDIGYWEKDRDILTYMPKPMAGSWDPCVAMATFAVYPQSEMLWKAGYDDIVMKFMARGKKCTAICRLDGANMHEIFPRFTKQELRLLREKNLSRVIPMEHYIKLKRIYGARQDRAMKALEVLESHYWDRQEVLDTVKRAGAEPHRLFRYLGKIVEDGKAKKNPESWETAMSLAFTHWKDYIDAALEIGFDLSRKDVMFPKKLGQRHDVATKLHRELLAERQAEAMVHVWEDNEKRIAAAGNPRVIEVNLLFGELQDVYARIVALIEGLRKEDPAVGDKLSAALGTALGAMMGG